MKRIGGALLDSKGNEFPLSNAIEANGQVFVSGQLSLVNGAIVGSSVTEQTEIVMRRIEEILKSADLTLSNVVKMGVWLVDPADFAEFNAAYASFLSPPFPARATVIAKLAIPGALVEIDAIAVRDNPNDGGSE